MLQAEERFQPINILRLKDSERRFDQSMPITISEDSDDDLCVSNKPRRCMSLPAYLDRSIMKRRTIDESLHSTYGSEDGMMHSRKHLSLQFANVNIREYSRTVGDNPSCSSGPPISISWEYNIVGNITLDDYERTRPPRRIQKEMVIPRRLREDMLRYEWNASRKDITESIRRNVRIKNQRRTTINNLGKATKFEEAMESASRKLKRFVRGQKSVHKQVRAMEKKIDATNRKRSKLIYLEENMSQEVENMSQEVEESAPSQVPSPVPSEKPSLVLSGGGDGCSQSS
mmetsp:Transcript_50/g.112  ORF Transcript_50/g.112 Transcript_50/m.112 type:complete len:286 (-) Transcript_50:324-1181(-)